MTAHYRESKLPVYFVFAQTFEHNKSQNVERFFQDLTSNFDQQLQQNWIEYWQNYGEEIVLEQWNLKYGDYQAFSADEQACEETTLEEHNSTKLNLAELNSVEPKSAESNSANLISTELNSTELKSAESAKLISSEPDGFEQTPIEDYTAEWEALWAAHSEIVYSQCCELHTAVYEQYYLDFKQSLEQKSEEETEKSVTCENNSHYDLVANELDEILRLGLPIEFGSSNQKKKSAKHKSNHLEYPLWLEDIDSSTDDMDDEKLHKLQKNTIAKPKIKKKNRKLRKIPAFMLEDKKFLKYWHKRFSLFSLFDKGILLDRESWFSVTPEKIAMHQSKQLSCDIIVDAFCGCGGNTIQFARTCKKVIAVDWDPVKLANAKHNANLYGVGHKIEFICADFLQLCESSKLVADMVFLSPPWGGPQYKNKLTYDIEEHLLPVSATELMRCARRISENIGLYLPRNADPKQLIQLAGVGNRCEIQHNYLDTRLVAITGYYGGAIVDDS